MSRKEKRGQDAGGVYEKRKEIEKSLQKAVHPLIRQRSGGRAWESLVKQKIFGTEIKADQHSRVSSALVCFFLDLHFSNQGDFLCMCNKTKMNSL